jgi:integrase
MKIAQYCAAILAANTSMRDVEVKHLRRKDFDAEKRVVHIRTSKNETSKTASIKLTK